MAKNAYTLNTCKSSRPQLMPLWCLSASGGELEKSFYIVGAGMVELADTQDSKSCEGNLMRVRFPLPAPTV